MTKMLQNDGSDSFWVGSILNWLWIPPALINHNFFENYPFPIFCVSKSTDLSSIYHKKKHDTIEHPLREFHTNQKRIRFKKI